MNVPEKHRELAHAEIEGAVIQWFGENTEKWHKREYGQVWAEDRTYRIDPLCEYVISRIPEHNREAYVHFHNGGEVEFMHGGRWVAATVSTSFDEHSITYRPKPKTVKRWQWLVDGGIEKGIFVTGRHLSEGESYRLAATVLRKIPETEKEFPV